MYLFIGILFLFSTFPSAAIGSNAKDKTFFRRLTLSLMITGLALSSYGTYLMIVN